MLKPVTVACPVAQLFIFPVVISMHRPWFHAFSHSCHGLHQVWHERAFRQEVWLFLGTSPLAFYLGSNWLETAFLLGCGVLVLVIETLNTAIERTVDRIGLERHPLAKQAKDLGSAAVLLALSLWVAVWLAAGLHRL
jgi:diacylglycerol kinase (ATP)